MNDSENDWLLRDGMIRQNALGAIVLESAYLERLLRCVFTALIGSKYAAVVSGGKVAWASDRAIAASGLMPQGRRGRSGLATILMTRAGLRAWPRARRFLSCSSVGRSSVSVSMNNLTNMGCTMFLLQFSCFTPRRAAGRVWGTVAGSPARRAGSRRRGQATWGQSPVAACSCWLVWAGADGVMPSAASKRICWSGRGRSPFHTMAAVAVSG
jgi:hypothetical protein